MDYLNDPTFLRQLIMDHYEHPRNKRVEEDYPKSQVSIDSCIDDLTIQANIVDGYIVDIAFDGQACTIATSSTSIMTELLKGKRISDAKHIIEEYNKMIHLKDFDSKTLGEAVAFSNVGRQANRIHCATLGWRGLQELIDESEDK